MSKFKQEAPTKPATPSVLPKPVVTDAGINIAAYRLAASMLLTYAVDGSGAGKRNVNDPVYRLIVENRVGPKYSSCGDLAHWLLYRLGVRAQWVNRAEFRAPEGKGWRVGLNLNLLVPPPIGSNTVAVKPTKLITLPDVQPGDLLQIANVHGGHQVCVSGRDGDVVTTAEYGQPGGAKKQHKLTVAAGALYLGANQVTSWISLEKALSLPSTVGPDLPALVRAQAATLAQGFDMRPFEPMPEATPIGK